MKNLNENFKFSRYSHSFIWLKDAGVALPVFCSNDPQIPLLLSKATNLFKLFLSDVGLLAAMYMDDIQIKILSHEKDINFGAIYENVCAQLLHCHGFDDLYYYNNKKSGEIDFLIEKNGEVIPLEIKSGKDYARHSALNNLINNENYKINHALVFCNDNYHVVNNIEYLPIYMIDLIKKR